MNTEQKAKAYDEALERAKEYYDVDLDNTLPVYAKGTMEYLFPELKENEDERIRKELLEHCKNQAKPYIQTGNKCPQIQSWIAWLEKQGEQEPIIPKFRINDVIKYNQKQWTIIGIDMNNHCYNLDNDECVDFDTADYNFELVEQKTTEWSEEDEENYLKRKNNK